MTSNQPEKASADFYPLLKQYLDDGVSRFDAIPDERKDDLAKVAEYICDRHAKSETAKLTFICTHNSRRSHFTQIWAQLAIEYYGLDRIETYSGGTEATALNPRTVAALQRCGMKIVAEDGGGTNPRYRVYRWDSSAPLVCFSKVYSSPPNPSRDYCAVMTCSQADEACPLVLGCDLRLPIRYEDPKVADDTQFESQTYDERSAQICSEMLYLMSLVKNGKR
ncbi:protein-tyrosine-phosphatase [Novipirellula caenicola]|uniref:Arsenate reductase n=1 Tax=Novipirellula caenicola TaxID=1536901 RepID=A0ABP9VV59_9BACT